MNLKSPRDAETGLCLRRRCRDADHLRQGFPRVLSAFRLVEGFEVWGLGLGDVRASFTVSDSGKAS